MGLDLVTMAATISKLSANGQIGQRSREIVEVIPKTAVAFEETEGVYAGLPTINGALPISDGDVLSINYDGVEYKCSVITISNTEQGEGGYLVAFGNLALGGMGDATSEPFMGMYTHQPEVSCYVLTIVTMTSETTHTFGITKEFSTIHPIDPQYLAKRIDLADYGIDLATIVVSGVKKTVLTDREKAEAFYNDINCGKNLVCVGVFGPSTLEAIPSLYASDADGMGAISFALATVYGGSIIKADIIIQCGVEDGVLNGTIYVFCDTTMTALS